MSLMYGGDVDRSEANMSDGEVHYNREGAVATAELADRLAHHAPITMRVSKEAIRRLLHAGLPDGDDLSLEAYGSDDFKIGVNAFVDKREPKWTGK